MFFFKLSLILFTIALFLTACNRSQSDQTYNNPYPGQTGEAEGGIWARENLDLQAVGHLLKNSDNAEDFERRLNLENSVNNLDLNGDGYADYISVAEYDDRYTDQRGFSLYDEFGPNDVQEIARIIFDRYDDSGTRVLLYGNEQIYGDDYYYEADWRDRNPVIVDWIYANRDDYYRSPYYYENYPNYYEVYQVVETPVYRTRVRNNYYEPVFVQTTRPTIREIKIKSPYNGRTTEKIFANLAKPTREQMKFKERNPRPSEFVRVKDGKIKENSPKFENRFENKPGKNPNDFENPRRERNEKFEMRDRPERIERENIKPNKPNKIDRENFKPNKVERENVKPNRVERPNARPNNVVHENRGPNKPNKPANEVRSNGNGKSPGAGKPDRSNGGGNPRVNQSGGKGNGGGNGNEKGGGKKGKP